MTKKEIPSPILDETLPHQMNFPSYKGTGIQMEPPFVNKYGVVIGDSDYDSANSPLNNWSDDVDPSVMAGDEWIHPTNDIGWTSAENQDLLEEKKDGSKEADKQTDKRFMHPQFGITD